MLTRRNFLVYLGVGSYSLLRATSALGATFPLPRKKGPAPKLFKPVRASREDLLTVPKGFRYDVVASCGDALGSSGPLGAETFGGDNDFLCYFSKDELAGGKNPNEGLLWVNHEAADPRFLYGWYGTPKKTREQIQIDKLAVGGSVIHVKREGKKWARVAGEKTRRFTALYPDIALTGPVASQIPTGKGTLANCSGGKTLWNTALSCEENYQIWNPTEGTFVGYWGTYEDTKINEREYGYVVEIDPFGELPPLKHSAMGRFAHENVALRVAASGRVVAYMGDDSQDQYLYKYVSDGKYNAKASRAENRKLLSEGTLYAANLERGEWLPLSLERNAKLKAAGFKSQADVILETRKAAMVAGATPLDRPEDCEIHPKDGSVYIALTNSKKHGNFYGQIVRLVEKNDAADGEKFSYEIFLVGGPQSGLSSPDNLCFDRSGNLWVSCDVGADYLGLGSHDLIGNNGLFMVPTAGPSVGDAFQFASGPCGAELTGPWFNASEDTLFLSVQHPGEGSDSPGQLVSHWPLGGSSIPKASVVAVTGF